MHEFVAVIDDLVAPELVHDALVPLDELAHWVKFVEPQLESTGDGPYWKAQIWASYLQAAEPSAN